MKKLYYALALAAGFSLAGSPVFAQGFEKTRRAVTQGDLPFLEYGLGGDRLNEDDEKRILDPAFHKDVAGQIYKGIRDWLREID